MLRLVVQVNSTGPCVVSSFAKRTAGLQFKAVVLTAIALEGLTCQLNATPSSPEEQFSTTQQCPFTEPETTLSMVGFWRCSAKVDIELLIKCEEMVQELTAQHQL